MRTVTLNVSIVREHSVTMEVDDNDDVAADQIRQAIATDMIGPERGPYQHVEVLDQTGKDITGFIQP